MTKYYKILNEKENHRDFQYKTGLNVDTVPFNPSGKCQPGGLYFSEVKDIFVYLDYGPYIREVVLPNDAKVYKEPCGTKLKADRIILKEREEWCSLKVFKRLVEEGANIHAEGDCALRCASQNGHLDVVKFLVSKGADIHSVGDGALRYASQNGCLGVVKFLVSKGADIHAYNDCALRYGTPKVKEYLKSLEK